MRIKDAYIGDNKIARAYQGGDIVHPSPVRDGLVLWYDFMGRRNTDAKRGIAEDLSGNGNHGTLTNFAYEPGSGYEDGGLRFDGVDDFVYTDFIPSLSPSFEIVLKPDTIQHGHILSTYENGDTNFLFQITRGGGYSFYMGNNMGSSGSLDNHGWSLITTTYDGVNFKAFGNGGEGISGQGDLQGMGRLLIGNRDNGSRPFSGYIRSVRVYNRALTPEEIAHNYQLEKERWNL